MSISKKISNKFNLNFFTIIFICISLILGIFFRFYNLDQKFYSYDETYTSLRASGYYVSEMLSELAHKDSFFPIEDFQKYQHPNPGKGVQQIISGLSQEESHHVPIYFILTRFWSQILNGTLNDVVAARSFSAFCSLLALFLMYLLCQELFHSEKVSLIAVALMAISPFHVLYGQYARPYSLFTAVVLLSSFLLLRAVKEKTLNSWFLYTLISILGFYTQIFMALVIVSHFIYVLILERFKATRVFLSFLLSSLIAFILGFMWIAMAISLNSKTGAIGTKSLRFFSLSEVVRLHLLRLSRLFVDTHNLGGIVRFEDNNLLTNIVRFSLISFVLIIVIYSLLYLIQKSSRREWLFILALIAVTGLSLGGVIRVIPNQMETRYYVPFYLGIQISVAYLIAQKLERRNNIFALIFVFLIGLGIISCTISSQAQIWWSNLPGSIIQAPQVVKAVNNAENPIVIWNDYKDPLSWNTHVLLGLSYKLNPKSRFLYLNQISNLDQLLVKSNSLLLFKPNEEIQQKLTHIYNLEPAYEGQSNPWLWKISK